MWASFLLARHNIIRNTRRDFRGDVTSSWPLIVTEPGDNQRPRWVNITEVLSRRYFFILSTVPNPLWCLNMSKHVKIIRFTHLQKYGLDIVCFVLSDSKLPVSSFLQTGAGPGVSFQYLYRLLWRIPMVKWNSINSCIYVYKVLQTLISMLCLDSNKLTMCLVLTTCRPCAYHWN